jgi:hypothetical protein
VPTARPRAEEVAAAPERAATFAQAVELLLREPARPTPELRPVGAVRLQAVA